MNILLRKAAGPHLQYQACVVMCDPHVTGMLQIFNQPCPAERSELGVMPVIIKCYLIKF